MKKTRKTAKNAAMDVFAEAGKTCFPVRDACTLAGVTMEQFASDESLQTAYRNAQLATMLSIRSKLVDAACEGDIKSIRLFIEHFQGDVLPRLEDMPEDE